MPPSYARGDAGSIISGWLVKVAAVIAVFGVCAFDAISIGSTYAATSDAGTSAASVASETWIDQQHNVQRAYDAAVAEANSGDNTYTIDPKTFSIDPDGTVHLTITRDASTVLVKRIGPFKHWAHVVRTESARYTA